MCREKRNLQGDYKMKKTTYFSDSAKLWLADLARLGTDCRVYEVESGCVKLRMAPCELPGNECGFVALLTVQAGEAGCVSDFLFYTVDDVKSLARLADTISTL